MGCIVKNLKCLEHEQKGFTKQQLRVLEKSLSSVPTIGKDWESYPAQGTRHALYSCEVCVLHCNPMSKPSLKERRLTT